MTPIDVIGWLAVAAVLTVYSYGRTGWFDRANVVLCIPVAAPALMRGAYPSAAISLAFGAIGAWHLWNGRGTW